MLRALRLRSFLQGDRLGDGGRDGPRLVLIDLHQSEATENVEDGAEDCEQLDIRSTLADQTRDIRFQSHGEARHSR